MVLLKAERLREWLKLTGKNQEWLAARYKCAPSYWSQVLHNRTHISANLIGFLLALTHMQFDELFYYDEEKEHRRFWGDSVEYRGKLLKGSLYYRVIGNKIAGQK